MLLLVSTEAALFGVFVATYFYLRFRAVEWPPPGTPEPKVLEPAALTALLVLSSLPIARAVRSAKRQEHRETAIGLATAAAIAILYLVGTMSLLVDEWHTSPATKAAYDSLFFTLQGAHTAHVAAGVLMNLFLLARILGGPLTQYRVNGIWAVGLCWHFVNAMALVILVTTISPAL
jgi:heme/copper-type cytochrome/quinol oxidase subunit 3